MKTEDFTDIGTLDSIETLKFRLFTPTFTFRWSCLVISPFGDEEMIISERSLAMKQLCESSVKNSTLKITHVGAIEFYKARSALQILEFCASNIGTFEYMGNLRYFQMLSDFVKIEPFQMVQSLTFHCHE
jgi:hypothetical protein